MKIKIISCNDTVELETLVNEFIENKIVHDIKYQPIVYYPQWDRFVPRSVDANDRVLIIYDDEETDYVDFLIKKGA